MKLDRIVLYFHGKNGSGADAEHFRQLFPDADVIGLDYDAATPWEAADEFPELYEKNCREYNRVTLIANSIGAFFALCSLADKPVEKAYFISPVVDMERLILDMLRAANATEDDLRAKGEIKTDFGETLIWRWLTYVRDNPILWKIPTKILYGETDKLTSIETISSFAEKTKAELTVMPQGEHWFHTDEQMRYLDQWITDNENRK